MKRLNDGLERLTEDEEEPMDFEDKLDVVIWSLIRAFIAGIAITGIAFVVIDLISRIIQHFK